MNRVKALIKSDEQTWWELKEIIRKMIEKELSREYNNLYEPDKIFAEVHRRAGLTCIMEILNEIERQCLYENKQILE